MAISTRPTAPNQDRTGYDGDCENNHREADLCIVMFGGGVTSYEAARRAVEAYGRERTEIWFADTRTEDRDLYRFNREVEGLLGLKIIYFTQGKDVWDVFFDERMLGNSRIDPCSKFLKRKPLREELERRFKHYSCSVCGELHIGETPTVFSINLLGEQIHEKICTYCENNDERYSSQLGKYAEFSSKSLLAEHEARSLVTKIGQRMEPADEAGNRVRIVLGMDDIQDCDRIKKARLYWGPFVPWFPLTEEWVWKTDIMRSLIELGVQPPRLYNLGFKHNNCGGFCVKAGRGQFAHLHKNLPNRYLEHERKEQEFREFIQRDVSILMQTNRGVKSTLTLRELRMRIESGEEFPYEEGDTCTCFNPIRGVE